MTRPPPEPVDDAGRRMLGWAADVVLGTLAGLLVGFVAMVGIDRLDGGLWSVLPPLGVLAGLVLMRWDRDRAPHPGRHRRWVVVVAAVLSVSSVVLFTSLAIALSRLE